jgi:hypothetical protein
MAGPLNLYIIMTGNMKKRIVYILAFLFVVMGCGKDRLETRPSIKIKSLNATYLDFGQELVLEIEFQDKEGDISDSIYFQKVILNQWKPAPGDTLFPEIYQQVPDYSPQKPKGIIRVRMRYTDVVAAAQPHQSGTPPTNDPDTIQLRVALQDEAKNVSDTITTEQIIIKR